MEIIFVFFIGAVFGSFINATAYRIVRKMDFIFDRSNCSSCHQQLSFLDMIPIISYVLMKGRCRYCKNIVSKRYLATEALGGLNAIVCWNLSRTIEVKVLYFVIFNILLLISLIDIETKEISDFYQIFLLSVVVITILIEGMSFNNYIGMIIISFPLLIIALLTNSIGGADVKLFFTLGLLAKTEGILIIYLMTIVFASVFALYRLKREKNKKEEIALIPFIYLAFFTYTGFEKYLLNWFILWLT
jgi:leader peptidase (prepilin peptidase)/N-methyltransferase